MLELSIERVYFKDDLVYGVDTKSGFILVMPKVAYLQMIKDENGKDNTVANIRVVPLPGN